MSNALDAIVEIFTWIGFGAGALVAGAALILYLADGTWVPARAMIENAEGHRVARWFDDTGGVGEAVLSPAQEDEIGPVDAADVFVRQGRLDRMRTTRRSPTVRAFVLLAGGLCGLGAVAFIVSMVTLFARG